MKKNEIIVRANMTDVPAEMIKVCENLQSVLNNVNASKKQLAVACYEMKVQASESKLKFKDFFSKHFSAFDISDSRVYAYAQVAETFDKPEYSALWDRIPVSKLEKMCRIKKAKGNTSALSFGYIAFIQCISIRETEKHNIACDNSEKVIAELKRQYELAKDEDRVEDIVKLDSQIRNAQCAERIIVPENGQYEYYLNDGISRICAMTDNEIGNLVKIYNQYSDIIVPDNTDNTDNTDDTDNTDNTDNNTKKSLYEMIADTIAMVQNVRETAKAENIKLPETTINAFIEAMQNFGK